MAGLLALISLAPLPGVAAVAWELAVLNYPSVLLNLNPLLEYDGYYALMDELNMPNLRQHALRRMGRDIAAADLRDLRSHRVELLYGVASVLYVAVMALITLLAYRATLAGWVSSVAPGWVATWTALALAALVVMLCILAVLGELRGTESEPA